MLLCTCLLLFYKTLYMTRSFRIELMGDSSTPKPDSNEDEVFLDSDDDFNNQ